MGYDNYVGRSGGVAGKLFAGCGIGALVGVAVLMATVISIANTNNSLVRQEEGIIASYNNGENVHSNTLKKIKQAGFVTENYSKQVQDAINGAIRGRYGADGIRANMTWIQEQNPNISPDLFSRVLTLIEAGNNEFAATQTDRLDRIRVYRSDLRVFPNSLVAGVLGFPKLDLEKYGKVVSVQESKQAMETGNDTVTNPFGGR
ncbi:MAG: hypothetical protein AB7L09_02500 [Nitrospira sp.]